jgi:two-component system chemotaxis sensor kinase CheA
MDSDSLQQFIDQFLTEADDLVANIEMTALSMAVDEGEDGGEAVNTLFRAFHTLKGNAGTVGFDDVRDFTHEVETMLDHVRAGAIPVTDELSNLILASADHVKILLFAKQGGDPAEPGVEELLLGKVRSLIERAGAAGGKEPAAQAIRTWRIRYRPALPVFAEGAEPVLLFEDLRRLGECKVTGHLDAVPELEQLDPDYCHLWWDIELTGAADKEAILSAFLFTGEGDELRIEAADPEMECAPDEGNEAKEADEADEADAAEAPLSAPRAASAGPAPSAQATREGTAREAMVKVPSAKLDRLVNLVGELVMNQSRLATAAAKTNSAELAAPVEEIERLVAALRDDVLQIRMMPIGSIFGRFKRLVHDLSKELGKDIRLITEGEDTELDKSVLDQLADPLVHLVRNSADHGIEQTADRVAKGKTGGGTIRLSASHRGSDVVVCIEDDGAGMNRERIRAKAVARQLIAADANLSDKEILNLILLPGFSTAEAVTNLSGRGVGMDVVKRQIEALHGLVSIESEEGKGSRVSLTLPLTLAIIEGLLVEVADEQYVIPMAAVTENVELTHADRNRNNGRNLVAVRGELIPYIDLRESFRMGGAHPPISKIVLVRHEGQRVGMVVDRVMGTHQTVIQSLGSFFRGISVVSGSTVMGDGRVALILDIAGVVRLSEGLDRGGGRAGQLAA